MSGADKLGEEIGRHAWWWGDWKPQPPVGVGLLINVDTVYMTVVVVLILLALALLARRNLSLERPTGVQNILELIMEFINGFVTDSLGVERGPRVAPLAITLFMFILVANYIGLLPIPAQEIARAKGLSPIPLEWHSPTSDINTTAALALLVIVYIQFAAIRAQHGVGGWLRHTFISHGVAFAPLAFIEEIARPITLAFRLFGNIFAGEVLILVFGLLLPWWAVPIPHLAALFLAIFVGAIQAFIFTMLTIAYVGIATAQAEH